MYSEQHKYDASGKLKPEPKPVFIDEVHDERHAGKSDGSVYEVGKASADAGNESKPAALVYGSLYAKHSDRSHWSRNENAYQQTLEYDINKTYF